MVGTRKSLHRESKALINFLRSTDRREGHTDSDQGGFSSGGDTGITHQEGSGDAGGTEDEG